MLYPDTKDISLFFKDRDVIDLFTRRLDYKVKRRAPSPAVFPEELGPPAVTVLDPASDASPQAAEVVRELRAAIIKAGLDVEVGFIKSGGASPFGNLLGLPGLGLYYAGFEPRDLTPIVAETFVRGNIISPLALMSHTKATDTRFLFDLESGFIAAIDGSHCMVRVARYFADWEEDVSCGMCTPCRVGSGLLRRSLARLTEGEAAEEELDNLRELLKTLVGAMSTSTYCRFGITTSAPIAAALKHFPDEFEAHLEGKCPARACEALLQREAEEPETEEE